MMATTSHFIGALVLLLALNSSTVAGDQPPTGANPNIVFILADDLGYGDPGCYNDRSKIPTPHIDRLAQEGVRFTDAHSPSSVCTPTRYGILTGRYAWRTNLKRSVLWPWELPLIEPGRLTLPQMLKDRGYHTACVGKWHLGWDWPLKNGNYISDEHNRLRIPAKDRAAWAARIDFARPVKAGPLERGFEYYFGDDVPNFPPYVFIENDTTLGIPATAKPKKMFGHDGPALPGWDLSTVMPTLTQKAIQYIEQRVSAGPSPFFLFMPLTAPHTPIAPSPHFSGTSDAGAYGDFVCQVDWTVGQILEALDRHGLAENTLVVFTSDNGSPARDGTRMSGPVGSVPAQFGHEPSRPWRGMKADIWEAGHRVPFIARWPGRAKPGTTSDEPIILVDMMRTVAGIVGYELTDDDAPDSCDIRPALSRTPRKNPIRPHLVHHSGNGVFAIRVENWKLILGKGSGGFTRFKPAADAPAGQLYDLASDPGEQNNLFEKYPDVVNDLTRELDKIRAADGTVPIQ